MTLSLCDLCGGDDGSGLYVSHTQRNKDLKEKEKKQKSHETLSEILCL